MLLLLPVLVISPFLAIIAYLILVTSAPPTYEVEFMSQLAITLSHGFGPFLYCYTCSRYIFSCSTLFFCLYSISFYLCTCHLSSSCFALIFFSFFSSSSCNSYSYSFLFLFSFSYSTIAILCFSSSSRSSSYYWDETVPIAGWKPHWAWAG